jgi:hypothetical protein
MIKSSSSKIVNEIVDNASNASYGSKNNINKVHSLLIPCLPWRNRTFAVESLLFLTCMYWPPVSRFYNVEMIILIKEDNIALFAFALDKIR